MKTLAYTLVLSGVALSAAHAQSAYEVRSVSTTSIDNGVATNVQTNYVSATTVMPSHIGDAPATPAVEATGGVKVKLPSGEVLNVPDGNGVQWSKDSRLSGYDRFTFDPVNNVFVAGNGEAKYETNWDENGNRVKKAVVKTSKKVVKKAPVEQPAAEAPADTSAPAEEAPATEAPAAQ